jgi:hypothetical protein
MMHRGRAFLIMLPLFLIGAALFVTIGGVVVMALWNWLTPPLFGWKALTFWQALGLLTLCRILVGGFGMSGGRGYRRPPLSERWKHMTPEERERFRRGIWGRMGFAPTGAETQL